MDRDATSFMPSSLTLVASQQPPNVLKESDALSVGSEVCFTIHPSCPAIVVFRKKSLIFIVTCADVFLLR
jgi:hypothetical protein